MVDIVTYMAAIHGTNSFVSEALPDAPIRPDPRRRSLTMGSALLRQRLSLLLRRLADAVEPAPVSCEPALASGR